MTNKNLYSVQEWLPFEKILENGIIKLKNSSYIKLIEIIPINFNLKSEMEKEAILNSYKVFFKTCNFDIQILIQSNKEDLSQHISQIDNQKTKESEKIKNISDNYINYIKILNQNQKSSNKRFYIIIKNSKKENKIEKNEYTIVEELNENYYKVKECLSRCGNVSKDISNREEVKQILCSFINKRMYLNEIY